MANSRVVTSGAAITGVVRTAVVAAANTVTGGAAGAVDAAATGVGKALTPFWEKVQKETEAANTTRNNLMVSAATQQQSAAQPQQNSMMGLLAGLGPVLGSALSNIGGLIKGNSSGNDAPQLSPNPQELAQNTPNKDKGNKVKDPNKENPTAPNPVDPLKKSSNEQPKEGQLYGQSPMFNPDNIIS